jgi:valyl-tRNA synthetase
VLDPDRKKMSKSKGNVVTPLGLLDEHGSDAVRYWAAKGGPGVDTAFEPGQMKVGRRLAIKVLNASRFVLMKPAPVGPVREPVDRGMLAALAVLVDETTRDLAAYDYASALRRTEDFFWSFCDDYIELVKRRRAEDGEGAASANRAAQTALDVLLRLFAPFLPFVTEEVWSWWRDGSVHHARWPHVDEIQAVIEQATDDAGAADAWVHARAVTAKIRQARSGASIGFGTPVTASLRLPEADRASWPLVERDVLAGNNVIDASVTFVPDVFDVTIEPRPA